MINPLSVESLKFAITIDESLFPPDVAIILKGCCQPIEAS